jgi:HAD superfamily hydrolase (TIGR01509 family)
MLRALLWDVDGTLAETERDGHLTAFNRAFDQLGLPWRWTPERYGELLRVTGGRERLLHDFESQPEAPKEPDARQSLVEEVHRLKNRWYAELVAGGRIALRDGVAGLIQDCIDAGLPMGIVTTTSAANVEALLRAHLGVAWRQSFSVVVCAEQAPRKKPHPQAYQMALSALGVRGDEVVALEDSPAGLAAGCAVGIPVVVTRSYYFANFDASDALAVGPSLGDGSAWVAPDVAPGRVTLERLSRWHATAPVGAGTPAIRSA